MIQQFDEEKIFRNLSDIERYVGGGGRDCTLSISSEFDEVEMYKAETRSCVHDSPTY